MHAKTAETDATPTAPVNTGDRNGKGYGNGDSGIGICITLYEILAAQPRRATISFIHACNAAEPGSERTHTLAPARIHCQTMSVSRQHFNLSCEREKLEVTIRRVGRRVLRRV